MSSTVDLSRYEAIRQIVQQPVIKGSVMITPKRPFLYRLMDWIIVVMFGMFVGGVCALLFIGCDSPSAPSRTPVHHIPSTVQEP